MNYDVRLNQDAQLLKNMLTHYVGDKAGFMVLSGEYGESRMLFSGDPEIIGTRLGEALALLVADEPVQGADLLCRILVTALRSLLLPQTDKE